MKKMILCCLVAVLGCGVFAVEAKTPQKKGEIVTTVFTIDIDCESCAARIMNNVPVIGKGIKDIQVDVPSKEATVTYDSAKTSPEELIKGFPPDAQRGYQRIRPSLRSDHQWARQCCIRLKECWKFDL